jgi:threonylcarbamoyladenosine tRNA methylthiotransferase MtaB
MARKTTPQRFAALVEQAREAIPELAITTDLIAGFPGESDTEFAETSQFVRQQCFAGGHVFTYSPRPGTAATRLPNQVPYPIRKERNARLRQIIEDSAQTYCSQFLGQKVNVLWENTTAIGPEGWRLSGLTDTFIRIYATSPHPIWNQFTLVRVTGQTEKGLEGEIVTPKL